jgi:hypothetical protein
MSAKGEAMKVVTVNDRMQSSYRYTLVAPVGRQFDPEFRPELTPSEMLQLGVFCGKYRSPPERTVIRNLTARFARGRGKTG